MKFARSLGALCCALGIASCSAIPDVPDDYNLPIQEILQHTTCELRAAFLELSKPQYASFGATKWLIAVKLSPKTDREVAGGVGLTGKSTSIKDPLYLNSWTLGSTASPGAAFDVKGTRNASITFKMGSKDLLNVKKHPLVCPVDNPRYHALTQNLGIQDWLVRAVTAKNGAVGSLATLDTPTYSGEIFVKFSGNGSFTYTFPFGTNFASLSANYDLDETLEITLSPDKDTKIFVQTLPAGGNFEDSPPDRVVIPGAVNAEQRLDTTQNQQGIINAIKNLPR